MPKIVEIVASRDVKMNISDGGQYQSTGIFLSMKAELEEGDKPGVVALALQEKVDAAIFMRVRQIAHTRGKIITDDKLRRLYGFPPGRSVTK